jgi:hypothetical protein
MLRRVEEKDKRASLVGQGIVVSHLQVELAGAFTEVRDLFVLALQEWLERELDLVANSADLGEGSWMFKPLESESAGFIQVNPVSSEAATGLEIVVESTFFKGAERNRFRLLDSAVPTLEVSTTIESLDSTRPAFDIPRLTDSFLSILESAGGGRLSALGEEIQPTPWFPKAERESIENSPLARSSQNSGIPIVLVGNESISRQRLSALAAEFYGLAHVVALSSDLIPRNVPDFVLGVFWKDGSVQPDYFSRSADWKAVYRQLVRVAVRKSDFESRWRELLYKSSESHPTTLESAGDNNTPSSEQSLLELARLTRQINELEVELDETRRDREDYFRNWDESDQKLKTLKSKLREKNFATWGRSASVPSSSELELFIDLESAQIEEELEHLVSQTGGAVAFTSNVSRSWRAARKAGTDERRMAEQLEKLCKLAMDYKARSGAFGMPLSEYALHYLELQVVTFDDKLPEKLFTFEGKTYSQEHHIRADESRESFDDLGRIHFALDLELGRIIINHMGRKLYQNDKS